MNNLYVGNVPPNAKIEDLEDLLVKYGQLRTLNLKADFGFAVNFYNIHNTLQLGYFLYHVTMNAGVCK